MDVVFTTSFGYMDDTVKASKKYPNQTFMHASGFKQTKNLGTYFADLYQMYYLNGIMAGALTKTNKIGYVAAFPIPELIRHIDAFALGIKVANPKAKLDVRWIYAWYGPDKAKEAAEALIAEGVDALAFTEDTPAVIEVGQEHTEKGKQIYTFSHYSPMQPYGVDSVVSGQLVDWGIMYVKILQSIKDGTWNNKDMWWLAAEKGAILGGNFKEIINPKFIGDLKSYMIPSKAFGRISAYDLILKRYAQMKKGVHVFDPFTGPIRDNKGKLRIKKGAKASKGDLLSMMYYVDNVVGNIPK
jgi:simple sugar transport system substrate-binding protein